MSTLADCLKPLPRHPFAKKLATDCLLSDNGSAKYALSNLFQMAVVKPNVPDLYPYVVFAKDQESQSRSCLTGTESELPHIISAAKELSNDIKQVWKQRGQERQNLDDIDLIDSLIHDLETAPACCILFNIYNVILKNWHDTKDLSATYCLLGDLVQVANNWYDSPATQADLFQMLRSDSEKWADNAFGE